MTQRPLGILGISAYYHDSAAALLMDGEVVAAAEEERFSRRKHDAAFPAGALRYCLEQADVALDQIDYIVFYDKPLLKFERLLETHLFHAPRSFPLFVRSMPLWLKEKLFLKRELRQSLRRFLGPGASLPPLLFTTHHQSHAGSAFYAGPFESSAVLCMDGVGEWATTSAWTGRGNALTPLWQIDFPHSLGLLYSAFTYFAGFKVNSGEYKLMGLAPYGEPRLARLIREELVDVKNDGSFRLNMKYFGFGGGLRMTNARFDRLFGGGPRAPDSDITQREMDLAASIQRVIEDIVIALCRNLRRETGERFLSLAGGVALNCVANARILPETDFEDIWIQPAAGDAGGALGAAWCAWHQYLGRAREAGGRDRMRGSYLGPGFDGEPTRAVLDRLGARYVELDDERLAQRTAELLAARRIVGWCQGRMEFGPRALGNRSILADPRDPGMQSRLNLCIKYRESFRPFAPAILSERKREYFDLRGESPYMLFVAPLAGDKRIDEGRAEPPGLARLARPRSLLPAVTHVDYTARVQTVDGRFNPRFRRLLECFETLTGCPALVNTSFNVRGEPIVRTPEEAYRCFMSTEMDHLVIGNFLLAKADQQASPQMEAVQYAPD